MLRSLHLKNVGPAAEMDIAFAPHLNLLTGDNGLGKSFLLDVAWWALTRRWPHDLNPDLTSGYAARPTDPRKPAAIHFSVKARAKTISYESTYVPRDQSWTGKAGRPWIPGLVVYAHADGGFSVWDPKRNYWRARGGVDLQERLPGYVFSAREVWDGLEVPVNRRPTRVCNGLLLDWATWIREDGENAKQMAAVLRRLVPKDELLATGPLVRLSVNDARDIPSIQTPYSDRVPVVHASAGIKRALGLAYMLLWSWNEHVIAADQLGEEPTDQVVMLFDEIESHLHPRWQRTILKSLLHVVESLHSAANVQLIAATHSPLVLASAEPDFNDTRDALWHLRLSDGEVHLDALPWARQGDVTNWLVSDVFGLQQARSAEAEEAIEAAEALMRGETGVLPPKLATREQIHAKLKKLLPAHDVFWPRWLVETDLLPRTSSRGKRSP